MNTDDLKTTLKSLHKNLSSAEKIDPELADLLQVLNQDIELLLEKESRDTAEASDLATRAQAVAAQFAAQHPNIEITLRELADTLGKMGI